LILSSDSRSDCLLSARSFSLCLPAPIPDATMLSNAPVAPPTPSQPGPSGTQGGDTEDGPRQSGRSRIVPQREGNVYPPGTTSDKDLRKKFGKHSKKDMLLGSVPEMPTEDSSDTDSVFPEQNVNSTTEGGVQWINELLSKAISSHDSLPDPAYVRDWTAKDLDRLPADQQKEWRQAQFEELEALRK